MIATAIFNARPATILLTLSEKYRLLPETSLGLRQQPGNA